MGKRVNPNRQPVTQATVERACKLAYEDGVKDCTTMYNTVLCDKFGADEEIMEQIYGYLCNLADSLNRGDVKFSELNYALKFESNIRITKH